MSIVLLNVVVIAIILGVAGFLTIAAVVMIIVSAVRHSKAKKKGKKTLRVGMWVGIIMLVIPWVVALLIFMYFRSWEKDNNYMDPSKMHKDVVQAVISEDAEVIYDYFAPSVIEECDISEKDIAEFLNSVDLTDDEFDHYISTADSRFTSYDELFAGGGRRPESETQNYFDFFMQNINSSGDLVYFAGQTSDSEDEDNVGIHYIVIYSQNDPVNCISIGRSETWADYPTPEIQEEINRLKGEYGYHTSG